MTLHNYRSRQVHETLNGVNPSSSFRDMRSAKSGPNLWQIWQVFGPWASPYGANGHMTMTVHTYRPRQFHRTSNGENPSSGYRDMGSANLAAARPPARTVTTIPLQPGGLRGKNFWIFINCINKLTSGMWKAIILTLTNDDTVPTYRWLIGKLRYLPTQLWWRYRSTNITVILYRHH